jgi:hypothetical protein
MLRNGVMGRLDKLLGRLIMLELHQGKLKRCSLVITVRSISLLLKQ